MDSVVLGVGSLCHSEARVVCSYELIHFVLNVTIVFAMSLGAQSAYNKPNPTSTTIQCQLFLHNLAQSSAFA